MPARDAITLRIDCEHERAVEVRANGEGRVWLSLVNPDGDGEVPVDRETLEDALAYVTGGGPGEWGIE